jgi:hypothetical protein
VHHSSVAFGYALGPPWAKDVPFEACDDDVSSVVTL